MANQEGDAVKPAAEQTKKSAAQRLGLSLEGEQVQFTLDVTQRKAGIGGHEDHRGDGQREADAQAGTDAPLVSSLVQGLPDAVVALVGRLTGRRPEGRPTNARAVIDEIDGLASRTDFQVIERCADGTTLLEAKLGTGRTNQIRLHFAHIGHPLRGDDIYGGSEFSRLCLHAYKLCFWHPNGARWMEFDTPIPDQF